MKLYKIMPHINLVISLMILVLWYIDSVNNTMGFLRGKEFKFTLLCFCIVGITSSIVSIVRNMKESNKQS